MKALADADAEGGNHSFASRLRYGYVKGRVSGFVVDYRPRRVIGDFLGHRDSPPVAVGEESLLRRKDVPWPKGFCVVPQYPPRKRSRSLSLKSHTIDESRNGRVRANPDPSPVPRVVRWKRRPSKGSATMASGKRSGAWEREALGHPHHRADTDKGRQDLADA